MLKNDMMGHFCKVSVDILEEAQWVFRQNVLHRTTAVQQIRVIIRINIIARPFFNLKTYCERVVQKRSWYVQHFNILFNITAKQIS